MLANALPQLEQHLNVKRRVGEPVVGEWPRGPVLRGMLLREHQAQLLLHHRRETNLGPPEQARCEFCVENRRWFQAKIVHAWKVLGRGVEDVLCVANGLAKGSQVGQGCRVNQRNTSAFALELGKVSGLSVAKA